MKKTTVNKKANAVPSKDVIRVKRNRPCHMGMPPGCAACGNPAYPACKNSCPMFDD